MTGQLFTTNVLYIKNFLYNVFIKVLTFKKKLRSYVGTLSKIVENMVRPTILMYCTDTILILDKGMFNLWEAQSYL